MDDVESVIKLLVHAMDSVEKEEPVDFESLRAQLVFHSDQQGASPTDEAGAGARPSKLIDMCHPIVDLLEAGDFEGARTTFRRILREWEGD